MENVPKCYDMDGNIVCCQSVSSPIKGYDMTGNVKTAEQVIVRSFTPLKTA